MRDEQSAGLDCESSGDAGVACSVDAAWLIETIDDDGDGIMVWYVLTGNLSTMDFGARQRCRLMRERTRSSE